MTAGDCMKYWKSFSINSIFALRLLHPTPCVYLDVTSNTATYISHIGSVRILCAAHIAAGAVRFTVMTPLN